MSLIRSWPWQRPDRPWTPTPPSPCGQGWKSRSVSYGYEDERYLAAAAGLGNACLLHFFIHLPDFRGRALAEGIRRIRALSTG